MELRDAFDSLKRARLKEICSEWGLKASGSADELRRRLAHFFRGDAEAVFESFTKRELVDLLSEVEFELEGYRGSFVRLAGSRVDTLRRIAVAIFGEGWEPQDRRSVPVRGAKPAKLRWVEDETASWAEEDYEEEEDEDYDEASEARVDDAHAEGGAHTGPEALRARLERRLASRENARESIAELVNLLGTYRAVRRLRLNAVKHLGRELARLGYATQPNLGRLRRSPGVEGVVTISRAEGAKAEGAEAWTSSGAGEASPAPPEQQRASAELTGATSAAPPPQPPAAAEATFTPFEIASRKLAVIVTLAATTSRLGEDDRELAVEASLGDAQITRAQALRLRGLAHKYASGHADVTKFVDDLHKVLPEDERSAILEAARRIGAPSPAKDELLAAYALDFGVAPPAAVHLQPSGPNFELPSMGEPHTAPPAPRVTPPGTNPGARPSERSASDSSEASSPSAGSEPWPPRQPTPGAPPEPASMPLPQPAPEPAPLAAQGHAQGNRSGSPALAKAGSHQAETESAQRGGIRKNDALDSFLGGDE